MGKKNIPYIEETYDVVVVGAGHAGCEAALACARLGLETMMFTVSVDSIALMPCNPNIGGSSKCRLMMTSMISECAKSFERLPILLHADILRNILYSGVWSKYEYIQLKKKRKKS